jgi:hypothetical protein
MIWLLPFLAVTAVYSLIVLGGIFFQAISDMDDMKAVYRYYGVTLLFVYCIFSSIMIIRSVVS